MKTKLLLLLTCITMLFLAVGCDSSKLTALPTPTIRGVDNQGYVYWDAIDNAYSYILKINDKQIDVGKNLKYSIAAAVDSEVDVGVPTELHIFLKATANAVTFSDSNWSLEYTYTYTKEQEAGTLSTPTIASFSDNTIRWNSVLGAEEYVVKINENEFVTTENFYDVYLSENGSFTCAVQARANNNTLSSAWSATQTYTFVKKEVDANTYNYHSQYGVGRAIDVATATSYGDYKKGSSVLDYSFLTDSRYKIASADANGNGSSQYSHSITDFMVKMQFSKTEGLGVSGNVSPAMTASIGASLQNSLGASYSQSKGHFFYSYDYIWKKTSVYLQDYANTTMYKNALSESFLADLATLYNNQNQASFTALFEKYGTHVIGAGYMGGRVSSLFSLTSKNTEINANIASSLSSSLSFGMGSAGSIYGESKTSLELSGNLKTDEVATNFKVLQFGGGTLSSTEDNFNTQFSTWTNSITDSNAALVDFGNDGLIALWNILPDEYVSMKSAMEQAFITYLDENYSSMIAGFENTVSDTVNFAGGNGTASNPYLISSLQHVRNIENDMSAHYKLINDVDVSGMANWEPLGGLYLENPFNGTLDGDGHKITGLSRTHSVPTKKNRSFFGFFGFIGEEGVVKNVDFEDVNCSFSGSKGDDVSAFFAVVAGKCMGTVSDVKVKGSLLFDHCIAGGTWLGGIAGYTVDATITNCENHINLYSARYASSVGGIVAYGQDGELNNCKNFGNLSATCTDWGGIAATGAMVAYSHNTNRIRITTPQNFGTQKAKTYDNSNPVGFPCPGGKTYTSSQEKDWVAVYKDKTF